MFSLQAGWGAEYWEMSGGLGTKVQVRGGGVDEGGQNSGLFEDSLQSYLQSQFQEDSPVEPKPNGTNKTVQESPSSGSETLNENGVKMSHPIL